ncbi:mammalian cell entry protein [Mycolicibacterium xanthum]|uniref:mammalian cell entry protein n=1 Tax=Mycolicibacterium xanthum TaxID=2796469 RepID=UPI002103DA38|nr:mammalian cell entry protein [Mycolicibacterium xanthum]
MSPRRNWVADHDAENVVGSGFFTRKTRPPRRWGLPVVAALCALLVAAAITAGSLMLVRHETDRREALFDAAALSYAGEFMTMYTTLDPFHANDYADRILAQGTGDFAKMFSEKKNEILIQVAQAEPTTGEVTEAGVQRRNDDGSADVLIATKVTTTSPDGKSTVQSGSRWIATTIKEGQQWKISNLIQVI